MLKAKVSMSITRKRSSLKILSFLTLLILVVSTFLGATDIRSQSSAAGPTTFSIGEVATPPISALNPFNPSSDYTILGILYDYMFSLNWPPLPMITPIVAGGYTMGSNGSQYVVSVKPNLKWDNGSPLNATDLWYTLSLYNESGFLPQTFTKLSIMNSTAVNFTLSSPNPLFILQGFIGNGIAVLPYQTFHSISFSNLTNFQNLNNIVADGPFVIQNYTTNANPLVFKANPYYWNGAPKIQSMDYYFYSSPSSYLNAFVSGQLSAISPGGSYQQIQPIANLPGHSVIGPPYATPGLTVEALLNAWVYPTNTTAFRRALAFATNVTQINNEINGPYANQSATNQDFLLPTYNQQIGFNNGTGVVGYSYNVAQAKQILTSAGFKYSGSTLEYSNGTAVTLTIKYRDYEPYSQGVATLLSTDWSQIGIKVTLQDVPSSTLRSGANNPNGWQVIVAGVLGPQTPSGVTPGPGILNDLGDYFVYTNNGTTHTSWNSTVYGILGRMATEPANSSLFYSDARTVATMYVQGVPEIPLFNTFNWLGVSDSYTWGSPSNYTGVYYTQAITGLEYWDLALDAVAPASSSGTTTTGTGTGPVTSVSGTGSSSSGTGVVTTSAGGLTTTTSHSSITSNNNLYVYIGIAVVAILLIGAAITAVKRRKPTTREIK